MVTDRSYNNQLVTTELVI